MGLPERVAARRLALVGRTEHRAVEVPWRPWSDPSIPFDAGGPGHPSRTGRASVDAALRLAPLYAGTRLLADMVASLPIQCYRTQPGSLPAVKAPMPQLLQQPSAYGTVYDWLHQMMTSLVLQGNAWGLITGRDGYGFPTGIEWLPAEHVYVQDDEQQPWNTQRARIFFFGRELMRDELFHVRAFTVPGRLEGLSPVRLFMTLIGAGNDAVEYGASWFRAGGFPPGTFQNTEEEVDRDDANEIRRRLTEAIRNRQPLVYGRDWDYKPVAVPPSEAQFLESIQMTATQMASVLGIPPERIGGTRGNSLTYSTQEQETIALLTDTLRPWLVRVETALFQILPASQYARFDTRALLRTTIEQRFAIHKLTREAGLRSANEIRADEEWEPIPGKVGDDPLPLEVLVSMSRGIGEIPKSFSELVTVGPNAQAQMQSAEKQAATRPAPPVVQGPAGSPGRDGRDGQGGAGAQQPSAPGGVPQPSALAAARAAREWLGDYDGPAPASLNGHPR